MNLHSGQLVGQYQLEHRIGAGGMGNVWAAQDTRNHQPVALKVLRAEQSLLGEARIRLRREAHATRSIAHPAIVPVIEVLDWDESPVLVMELLKGETLRALLRRESRLPLKRAAELLQPIAQALARAHAAGIVHRDLKPENIFLESRSEAGAAGLVRLLDFGVARFYEPPPGSDMSPLTGVGAVVGTAAYMAPEQALHPAEVDHRVDVWALGVTLYEALSGCRPIEGVNDNDTVRQLLVGSITPIQVLVPDLPAKVAALIAAMLSRSPDRRPSDLAETGELLGTYAGD